MQRGAFTVGDVGADETNGRILLAEPATPTDGRTPEPHSGWPLRGREDEVAALCASLRRARATRAAQRVLLVAAPGMGRSALLREVSYLTAQAGGAVATVTGRQEQAPLEPLLLGLSTGRTPVLSAEATRALMILSSHPLLQVRLLERLLRRHATHRSLLVSVDDSHRLDPASRRILGYLPDLLHDTAGTWVHSVPERYVDSTLTPNHAPRERLTLEPLSDSAIVQLAADRMGGPPGPATRAALVASCGNPARACEVVDQHRTRPAGPGLVRARQVPQVTSIRDRDVDPDNRPPHRARFGWAAMTATELKVALLIADGHSNRSAAAALYVSPNTI